METDRTVHGAVADIVTARTGSPPRGLALEGRRLGGVEATETTLLTARYLDGLGRRAMLRLVLKKLDGRPAREADVYHSLVAPHAAGIAPELLAVRRRGRDSAVILLEAVRRTRAWPWRDPAATGALIDRLARFHRSMPTSGIILPEWDFEGEQEAMAGTTRRLLRQFRRDPELSELARDLRRFDRLAGSARALRRQLFAEAPFGQSPIHGDLHPGNALTRRRGGAERPVLIDWGRARQGSPLEDLSSWLQSLRFWEAEAERLHDTLFARYLSGFGMPRRLTAEITAAYWIAGASNAMAGALLHHLAILGDRSQRAAARAASFRAASDWMRVIRRAHAWTM